MTRGCDYAGCDRPHRARGYCSTHYSRLARKGTVDYPDTVPERFAAKTVRAGECWLWIGSTPNGYGKFRNEIGKVVAAHRWAYEHYVGPIPEGMEVDHTCWVTNCVNPDHLRPVTAKQNQENLRGANRNSKTSYRGVSRERYNWSVRVTHNGVEHRLYGFDSPEAANLAAISLRNRLFTHNEMDRITTAEDDKE